LLGVGLFIIIRDMIDCYFKIQFLIIFVYVAAFIFSFIIYLFIFIKKAVKLVMGPPCQNGQELGLENWLGKRSYLLL